MLLFLTTCLCNCYSVHVDQSSSLYETLCDILAVYSLTTITRRCNAAMHMYSHVQHDARCFHGNQTMVIHSFKTKWVLRYQTCITFRIYYLISFEYITLQFSFFFLHIHTFTYMYVYLQQTCRNLYLFCWQNMSKYFSFKCFFLNFPTKIFSRRTKRCMCALCILQNMWQKFVEKNQQNFHVRFPHKNSLTTKNMRITVL